MTDKNEVGVTVVGHEGEVRTLVNGYEEKGSYLLDVHYEGTGLTSNPQLFGLLNVSAHCEQFIKYECYHAALLYMENPDNCACGVTKPNSCADSSRECNCDKNDEVWREDSGLLTEKRDLPVSQLRFGDTGSYFERGYHTFGKLKCYGIAPVP